MLQLRKQEVNKLRSVEGTRRNLSQVHLFFFTRIKEVILFKVKHKMFCLIRTNIIIKCHHFKFPIYRLLYDIKSVF